MTSSWEAVERLWNESRILAWILPLSAIGLVSWATLIGQSPGVSIGLLALAAGIMSVRPKMHPAEKFTWVAVLIAFAILEVKAIIRSDEGSKTARDAQNAEFRSIAKGLQDSIATSKSQYHSTIGRVDSVLKTTQSVGALAKSDLDAVTGGKAFAEFAVSTNTGMGDPVTYPMHIWVYGKYPIRSLSAQIQKVELQHDAASISRQIQSTHMLPVGGDIIPGPHQIGERLGPGQYEIEIWTANGFSYEALELRLDGKGQLQQSYEVHQNGKTVVKVRDDKLIFRLRP